MEITKEELNDLKIWIEYVEESVVNRIPSRTQCLARVYLIRKCIQSIESREQKEK